MKVKVLAEETLHDLMPVFIVLVSVTVILS